MQIIDALEMFVVKHLPVSYLLFSMILSPSKYSHLLRTVHLIVVTHNMNLTVDPNNSFVVMISLILTTVLMTGRRDFVFRGHVHLLCKLFVKNCGLQLRRSSSIP